MRAGTCLETGKWTGNLNSAFLLSVNTQTTNHNRTAF